MTIIPDLSLINICVIQVFSVLSTSNHDFNVWMLSGQECQISPFHSSATAIRYFNSFRRHWSLFFWRSYMSKGSKVWTPLWHTLIAYEQWGSHRRHALDPVGDKNHLSCRKYTEDTLVAERRFKKTETAEQNRSDGGGFPLGIFKTLPTFRTLWSQMTKGGHSRCLGRQSQFKGWLPYRPWKGVFYHPWSVVFQILSPRMDTAA